MENIPLRMSELRLNNNVLIKEIKFKQFNHSNSKMDTISNFTLSSFYTSWQTSLDMVKSFPIPNIFLPRIVSFISTCILFHSPNFRMKLAPRMIQTPIVMMKIGAIVSTAAVAIKYK